MTVPTTENSTEKSLIKEEVDNKQEKVEGKITQPPTETKGTEDVQEDPNWRAFREARKKDRAEREAAERRASEKEAEVAALKAAMEAAFSKGSHKSVEDTYSPHEENEDEKLEKRIQSIIAEREAKAEKERQLREQQELPYRLKQAFPDYDQVVNEENGAYLEYHHPEVYRSLLRQPQNFETLCDTYKIVKKLIPNSGNGKKDSAKAEVNLSKPKSISSTGLTQTQESSSARLTEDRKAANWERMQRMMKGVS